MWQYNELYHHGIKGQKWGVRRFQNEDGDLTPAGEKRYSDVNASEHQAKSNKKVQNDTHKNAKPRTASASKSAPATTSKQSKKKQADKPQKIEGKYQPAKSSLGFAVNQAKREYQYQATKNAIDTGKSVVASLSAKTYLSSGSSPYVKTGAIALGRSLNFLGEFYEGRVAANNYVSELKDRVNTGIWH